MGQLVDRLTAELTKRYLQHVETLVVDFRMEDGQAVLWLGFSLRSDHILRQLTLQADVDADHHELSQALIVKGMFQEIGAAIDLALAAEQSKTGLPR